uniref:Meiosis-specific protein ASY3-like coiled-coil domain-containing protein n=1 Tax=Solanum tuberosum TaxID=4113 RepID=M1C490_SOLTU
MECDTEDSEDNSNIQADSNHRLVKFVIPGNNLLDQTKSSSTKVVLIFLESVEILTSVAKKVHMQLQNAEFHIQADMGRITSLNKLKRKHVEEVLQEKLQHLSSIYERCKEEVTRHLQDCKSTLQSLEAHDRSLLASTCEGSVPSPEGKNQVGERKEQSTDRRMVPRCSVELPKVTDLEDVEGQGKKGNGDDQKATHRVDRRAQLSAQWLFKAYFWPLKINF